MKSRKAFMGCSGGNRVNGVAVYPANVSAYAPPALQAENCPWDENGKEQILKHAHISKLFQHIYLVGESAPSFPKDKDLLKPETALFHRVKDGSLIEYLREHGYTLSGGEDRRRETTILSPVTGIDRDSPPAQKIPTRDQFEDEVLGEITENKSRLEEFTKLKSVPVVWDVRAHGNRLPREGDKSGGMIFKDGSWQEEPKQILPVPALHESAPVRVAEPSPVSSPAGSKEPTTGGEARESASQQHPRSCVENASTDFRGGQNIPSEYEINRSVLVRDAVAILKQLCTSPTHTSRIRKELKSQG